MTRKYSHLLCLITACLVTIAMNSGIALSKDVDLEAIVQGNIESMGDPGKVAAVTIRGVGGTALVDFIQGGTGKMQGTGMFLSR